MISTLPNAIERDIYGTRAAEAAKITPEAMKVEVNKAYRRRIAREKKAQERIDLSPAVRRQPNDRSIRYTNMRSAMAEEGILRMLVLEPALFSRTAPLTAASFSSPLLGRVFGALASRWQEGLSVSLAALGEELNAEEMAHMTQVMQDKNELVSEDAFEDYRRIIENESAKAGVQSGQDLLALRDRLKQIKGYGG